MGEDILKRLAALETALNPPPLIATTLWDKEVNDRLAALEAKVAAPHDRLKTLEKAWDNDNTRLLAVTMVIEDMQAKQLAMNERLEALEKYNEGNVAWHQKVIIALAALK